MLKEEKYDAQGEPTQERRVDAPDAIRREEQHATVVFKQPEEDADHRVARDVVQRARFEEDVGLCWTKPSIESIEAFFES